MRARAIGARSWYTMSTEMAFTIVKLTDGARSGEVYSETN
jgi:hypothetical protein